MPDPEPKLPPGGQEHPEPTEAENPLEEAQEDAAEEREANPGYQ